MLAFSSTQDLFVPSALWLVSDEGPAVQHERPEHRRHRPRRLDADRQPGQLERHADDHLRLPVAALRRLGQQLRQHPGRDRQHLHARPGRRRQHDPRRRHRRQRRRLLEPGDLAAPTGTIGQLAPANVTLPVVSGITAGRPDADHHARRLERHRRRSTTTSSGSAATPPATTAPTSPAPPPGATCSPAPTSARRSAARSPPPTPPAPPPPHSVPAARSTRSRPANTVAPALSGVARDGQTLSAEHRHLDRHRPDRLRPTSGSAATPAAPTAPTSRARPARATTSTADDIGHAVRVAGHRHQRRGPRHRQLARRPPRSSPTRRPTRSPRRSPAPRTTARR